MGAFEDLLRQQLEESSRDFAPESVAQPIRTIENYLGKEYWTTNPIKQSYNLVHYPIGKKPGTKKEALEPPDLLPSPEIRDLFTPWSSHAIRQRKKNELSGWKFKHHKTGKMHPVEYMSNRNTKFGSTFIDTYGPNNEEKRIRNPYSTGAVTDFKTCRPYLIGSLTKPPVTVSNINPAVLDAIALEYISICCNGANATLICLPNMFNMSAVLKILPLTSTPYIFSKN